jgi:CxxC-x17-CxxC domain-containing protein
MAFNYRELTCRDCGSSFVFTSGEQEFYATKGLQHDPVRCPSCRQTRKLLRPEDREEAPTFGVYVSWGGRTPRQLHVAACHQCGQTTEVPFVPRGDRPVYCSNCYNDVRSKLEQQEAVEAEAAAARISAAAGHAAAALEGAGPARVVVRDEDADRIEVTSVASAIVADPDDLDDEE